MDPVFYSIEKEGKRLLYAHDTGYFPEETWEYLKSINGIYDFVSLDCTSGILRYRASHMGLEACVDVKARLIEMGLCDEHTKFILNHFSHNGKVTYDDLCALAEDNGFEVAYDGMTVEFNRHYVSVKYFPHSVSGPCVQHCSFYMMYKFIICIL